MAEITAMGEVARRLLAPTLLIVILAVISLLGAIRAGPASPLVLPDTPGTFPSVVGTTLNGERIALPADLKGAFVLVALGFSTADRRAVESWESIGAGHPDVAFYALATLGSGVLVSRFMIDNALRFAVTGEEEREHTIALHLDRAAFRHALGLNEDADALVVLLDGAGRELWRAEGPASDEAVAALDAVLAGAG
jgi:hypothetical protein